MKLRAVKWIVLFLLLTVASGIAAFDPVRDTFAFGNETLWAYGNQRRDPNATPLKTDRPYSRRCFVMSRAMIQFYQFAKFDPAAPRLSEEEYGRRIRELSRIPVSQKRKGPPVLFPGFANLQKFSERYPELLQKNLGNWWPTYFRPGNWRMALAFPRHSQMELASKLLETVQSGELAAIYITRFRPLNHCLVIFDGQRTSRGIDFQVCDPNLPGQISHLSFNAMTRSFEYQKTWYYRGGRVNVLRVYHSRWL